LPAVDDPLIRLDRISRTFQLGEVEVPALRRADLSVDREEYLSIVGPSGSGKSTLLHVLGLLDRPSSGSYFFEGDDVASLSESERTRLRGNRIGFVFQSFHLLAHRSVLENVTLAMLYNDVPRSDRIGRAQWALDRVGLAHLVDFRPTTLSGGERQRVAIARAIASRPAMLLCDEPTGNLDSQTSASILELFEDLRSEGLTLIVVTHDDRVSARADRTVHMSDGVLSEPAPA
jgi:putative ABC transport system ATP-binding protein